MSVLAIIQARLGSTRLPRKALMEIAGKPLIAHVVERVRQVRCVKDVVLAVPAGQVEHFWRFCNWTMGPDVAENDVLARFVAVAAQFPQHDTLLRATGDCPLFDPTQADRVLDFYRRSAPCEYAWNVAPGYVDGEDCEVFSRAALLQAHWHATDPSDREHVTSWIRRNYHVATLPPEPDKVVRKTSVDCVEDLERVRLLLERVA